KYEVWLLNNRTDAATSALRACRLNRTVSADTFPTLSLLDKSVVRSFNMRKVCAKTVPKLLTPEQNESRMNICADILNNVDTDPGLLDTVITCDDKIRKCGSG
ncbi:hypothetical protein NQ318_000419, partial [Aromia moschata]